MSFPAALIKENDQLFGILENNNGNEEEALLFIFNRNKCKYVLWENINPKRAGYLFVIEDESNLNELKKIITTSIEYKRYNLFMGTDTTRTFNFKCKKYYQLNHSDKMSYSRHLRFILSFYY